MPALSVYGHKKESSLALPGLLQVTCMVVHAAPWLTKLAYAVIQGKLEQNQDQLAREAVDNLEKLGPTFIKLGQILSIR